MNDFKNFSPGIYKHYKTGNLYTALFLVVHHETRKLMVVYVSHNNGTPNVRPLNGWEGDPDGWNDMIKGEPRFAYIGSATKDPT